MLACKLSLASLSGKELAQGTIHAAYMLHVSCLSAVSCNVCFGCTAEPCQTLSVLRHGLTHFKCMFDDAVSETHVAYMFTCNMKRSTHCQLHTIDFPKDWHAD